MKTGKIFILSGPSGSGKTTLHKRLLLSRRLKGKLVKSVSITTRPKRKGEREGRDYLFVTPEQFLHKKKSGKLLEWEKIFDNYYGTPKKGVKDLLKKGKNILLCIDVKGAETIRRAFPKTVSIFIDVPSLKELQKRLKLRGSESKQSLALRMRIAKKEIKEAKKFSYIVVNDKINKAVKKLQFIIRIELNKA